jgi:hypothetical protein
MSSNKKVTVLNGYRAVGILAGGQVYIPLPATPDAAEALRGNLNAHLGAVLAVDRVHALAVALQASRHILHDPIAEREALEEEREHSTTSASWRRNCAKPPCTKSSSKSCRQSTAMTSKANSRTTGSALARHAWRSARRKPK